MFHHILMEKEIDVESKCSWLTVKCSVNSLMEVSNGFTSEKRNEGIHFEIEDFHSGMKVLEVNHSAQYYVTALTNN